MKITENISGQSKLLYLKIFHTEWIPLNIAQVINLAKDLNLQNLFQKFLPVRYCIQLWFMEEEMTGEKRDKKWILKL